MDLTVEKQTIHGLLPNMCPVLLFKTNSCDIFIYYLGYDELNSTPMAGLVSFYFTTTLSDTIISSNIVVS